MFFYFGVGKSILKFKKKKNILFMSESFFFVPQETRNFFESGMSLLKKKKMFEVLNDFFFTCRYSGFYYSGFVKKIISSKAIERLFFPHRDFLYFYFFGQGGKVSRHYN